MLTTTFQLFKNKWKYVKEDIDFEIIGGLVYFQQDGPLLIKRPMVFFNNYFGKNTILESNAIFGTSSIGSNCFIGENTKIINCRIHNKVYIGENCILNTCKIRSHSNLNKNVKTDINSKLIFLDHSLYDNVYIANLGKTYQEIGGKQCLITKEVKFIR